MNRQRHTKAKGRAPWDPNTENESQRIGRLYPDASQVVVCPSTTQQLRTQNIPTTGDEGDNWVDGTKVDASNERRAWYPDTIPNHDVITGMVAVQGATRVEGVMSLRQEEKHVASTSDISASYAAALKIPSSMSSGRGRDYINGWPMNPTYNPSVGYHSGGCTIEGGLNPDTIVTVGLVPASQHGDSHAMEVGGPAFREYHSITPGTGAMTNSQSGPSTSRLTLMTHVDPEDMERRNAISMPTSSSTFQGVSCGVTENAGMIRSHAGRGLPAEEFEDNISKLTDRLISQGVDRAVVELCSAIFAQGVSLEALKARMTRDECEKHGLRSGMRYRMLLDVVKMMKTGVLVDRHVCRLCRRHEAADYKHHRDALRHLLRDHFGMGFQCTQCKQTFWTANELNRHAAVKHPVVRNK